MDFNIFNLMGSEPHKYNDDYTDELFLEDVIDDESLDDWTIDDILQAIPKTIETYNDTKADFRLKFNRNINSWVACYETNWGDNIYEQTNKDKYEALKQLYFKVKNLS